MHYLNILSPKLWRPATRLAGDTAKPHSTLTPAVHSDTFRSRLSCPRRSGTGHHTNATLAIFRTAVTYPRVAHFAPPERLSASLHSGSRCPGECSSPVPPSLLPTVSKCSNDTPENDARSTSRGSVQVTRTANRAATRVVNEPNRFSASRFDRYCEVLLPADRKSVV